VEPVGRQEAAAIAAVRAAVAGQVEQADVEAVAVAVALLQVVAV